MVGFSHFTRSPRHGNVYLFITYGNFKTVEVYHFCLCLTFYIISNLPFDLPSDLQCILSSIFIGFDLNIKLDPTFI